MKNSIKNCLTVFQRDPLLRGAVSYNILSERVDIVKPLGWERTSATLTDMDMKYLLLYLEEHYGLTSEKKVENAIQIVANENRYHPVRDYLNSLQWDGTERIRYALHHFLGADTDEYTFEALKLFMMGAIRRVFQPGSKFEVMLCLVGGQGAGKSTFFRLLAVKDEWFSDDLKKLDDENVYRKLQGHWIMEMSEMIATANARSIEEIKSFLSRQKETYKVPYETHPADRLRQCVFGGTTNRQDFLPRDRTGNRRFIPVTVYPERAEVHILDDEAAARTYISQMWAEAMTIKIPIETKQGVHTLPASSVIAVEAQGRKVVIHTTQRDFESIRNMQYWLELLPKNCFFQTHRSFIINFEHVTDFDRTLVHMADEQFHAYLTKRKYSAFKEAYLLYLDSTR